jgi:glycosyltransferase involved in cell wall biosynthesis
VRGVLPPLVSILIPARDAAATLPACLRSVARQTETRWECVVVDDGSRDATLACLRAFAAADDRFIVLARPPGGLVAALTAGLARCRGRWVARLDADDLMHRERLAAQLAALEAAPELVGVGCHVRLFPRAGLGAGWRAYERWLNAIDSPAAVRAEAFVECPLAHPTLVIRREVLTAFGYRSVGWPEDYDLVLRLLAAGHALGVVPRRLVAWRHRPGRLTTISPAYARARIVACKAAFLASGFLARDQAYVLCGYGATGRALCRALAHYGKRPSHVVEVHPRRLGNTIQGAPVVPYTALSALPRRPILVSVAGAGPRSVVRRALTAMGFVETQDFICAA